MTSYGRNDSGISPFLLRTAAGLRAPTVAGVSQPPVSDLALGGSGVHRAYGSILKRTCKASASHILVKTEAQAKDLKAQLASGAKFAELARKHSECPSSSEGGALGTFGPGEMVPEFDRVVFSDIPVGQCSEPVKTEFGWHLVVVTKR